ncbi:hypothetical protein PV355_42105 [Streptomyces stelliscabiei]|uniref:hypothetical protein n=1 Tax=Streptomyces stelliscabiei TaxID=146820 RepID=UPI0029B8DB02|nr:hypothetical protein [Streptomyces stelliscabiei]MDX2521652.1 hypothetical protein [Streptomyces stelliscabiei]
MKRIFRRCGHAPGALSPEDQAAVDQFRALLAALRDPEPWTPGHGQDIAVRVGPWIERARTRPGDDHGPDIIAVALQHPGGSYTPYGERYRRLGWLRCETDKILGVWNSAFASLTHAAAGLDLPEDVGMTPANYGVHVEARRPDNTGYTLLRLGPYFQTWLASHDADRLNTELAGKAATVMPGFTVTAKAAPFHVSDHESYDDPYANDVASLLAAAIAREVSA